MAEDKQPASDQQAVPTDQVQQLVDQYNTLVAEKNQLLGIVNEMKMQFANQSGQNLPDRLVACIGGGSNAMGLFFPFTVTISIKRLLKRFLSKFLIVSSEIIMSVL